MPTTLKDCPYNLLIVIIKDPTTYRVNSRVFLIAYKHKREGIVICVEVCLEGVVVRVVAFKEGI